MAAGDSAIRAERDTLAQAVLAGELQPAAFVDGFSDAVDRWLAGLLSVTVGGDPAGVALVAVGGYGRRQLCPGSDLDVVLLHQRRRRVDTVAEDIWYAIWDSGLKLDHAVRTPKEAAAVAREDQRVLLGLLDARAVAGDVAIVTPLLEQLEEYWRVHARRLLHELHDAATERHRRFGEVPFLLEPDLKESAGGLRDIAALALAKRALPPLSGLPAAGDLRGPQQCLLAARVVLQARTGSTDRLVLQEQDQVAAVLGHADADELMAAVAAAGREVMWAGADSWRRIASFLAGPARRGSGRDQLLGPGIVLRDGEVALAPGTRPGEDLSLLVEVAAAAAGQQVPIAVSTLDQLVAATTIGDGRWSDELRNGFVSLLEYGAAATPVLEVLDQRRLLERLLPEWSHVRNRPQRNAYHRYTVDRHLLETVAEAAKLIRSVSRPDLLLLAALFHDIGKDLSGDHSDAGADLARKAGDRMGLRAGDAAILERVVRLHLLLPDVATRRDLEDRNTVAAVVKAVEDRRTLAILAALAEADAIATGPAAWGPWKAGLIHDLVARADACMQGDEPPAANASGLVARLGRRPRGDPGVTVHLEDDSLVVVAADRPGLLSAVAGTLALHRLDIRTAAVSVDASGLAVEEFGVARQPGRVSDTAQIRADIEAALDGRLLIEARLAALEAAYSRRRPLAARATDVRVILDNDASRDCTVAEVRAADSHGLLYRLTRAIASAGLDVVSARVATMGHEVVDAFYVRDPVSGRTGGEKVDPERFATLEELLATATAPAL